MLPLFLSSGQDLEIGSWYDEPVIQRRWLWKSIWTITKSEVRKARFGPRWNNKAELSIIQSSPSSSHAY